MGEERGAVAVTVAAVTVALEGFEPTRRMPSHVNVYEEPHRITSACRACTCTCT